MITTIKYQRSFKYVIVGVVGQFFAMDMEGEEKPTEAVVKIEALLREFA
jgi:hypothetical protein